jgi:hypothetical protein
MNPEPGNGNRRKGEKKYSTSLQAIVTRRRITSRLEI